MIRTKKFFSVLLALVMVLALLPVGAAHATDEDVWKLTFTPGENCTGESFTQTVTKGESIKLPGSDEGITPPEGMNLTGWYDAVEKKEYLVGESYTPSGDVIFEATVAVKPVVLSVSVSGEGGTATISAGDETPASSVSVPPSISVTAHASANEGYHFVVWQNADGETLSADAEYSFTAEKDLALVAVFAADTPATVTYTVKFDANGGTGSMDDVTVEEGKKLKLPENGFKAPTGKEFDSWELLGKPVKPDDEVDITANTTVKATWKWLSYTVTFDSDGGGSVAPQTVTIGGKATKPTDPTKEGYTFDSWQTPQGAAFDFGSPVEADITLKAKWTEKKPDTFTVSFETNGGSTVEKQTVEKGKTAANPTAPTKKGYSFSGWYSDKDLKTAYDFTSAVTADLTLYAKWTEIKYTVSAGANGYYTLKSNKTVSITVKRSEADDTCLNHFSSVEIDGKTLTKDTDYTVKSGSTVVSFKPETLEKLAKGGHTVTVNFDDGKAETKLTIYAEGHSPKTGDENNIALWGAIAAVCVLGAAGGLILLTKKKRTDK